ncbi:MAG TPA: hypothetical protein VFC78_22475 [Tepidisphaeraceae bacterium]|nr:hypothetical protein [Tepidisphaeraceae bacterium]
MNKSYFANRFAGALLVAALSGIGIMGCNGQGHDGDHGAPPTPEQRINQDGAITHTDDATSNSNQLQRPTGGAGTAADGTSPGTR